MPSEKDTAKYPSAMGTPSRIPWQSSLRLYDHGLVCVSFMVVTSFSYSYINRQNTFRGAIIVHLHKKEKKNLIQLLKNSCRGEHCSPAGFTRYIALSVWLHGRSMTAPTEYP